jgi:hypothetical protein
MLYTDEPDIYNHLPEWGYEHKSVNHSAGEYARDEVGDGFHEVHVSILEGFWSFIAATLGHFAREIAVVSGVLRVPSQRPHGMGSFFSLAACCPPGFLKPVKSLLFLPI